MKRRLLLVLIGGAVIELSRGYFTPQLEALPAAPAGWTRVAETPLDPLPEGLDEWPGTWRALKAWRASYSGSESITLSLYAMPWSPGNAWDAIQRWRPRPGQVAFCQRQVLRRSRVAAYRRVNSAALRSEPHSNPSAGCRNNSIAEAPAGNHVLGAFLALEEHRDAKLGDPGIPPRSTGHGNPPRQKTPHAI